MNHTVLSLIAVSLLLSACNRNEIQATDSLEGEWIITAITSYYGDFSNNGFSPIETVEESGQLGSMSFGEDSVSYEFTRNDTLYVGSSLWMLTEEKVNEGFFRVPKFTLVMGDVFVFEVAFGNQTKNAERNATDITLTRVVEQRNGLLVEMELEKD